MIDYRRAQCFRFRLLWLLPLALFAVAAQAADTSDARPANALESVDYSVLPGNQLQFRFKLKEAGSQPQTFSLKRNCN